MAATLPRPVPLKVQLDQIPSALTYLNQWVLWRYVWKAGKDGKVGKWDKPPYQPTGKLASSTSAHTWSPFKTVKEAYEHGLDLPLNDPLHFDGVGFVPHTVGIADLQIVFGDLDKCRDKDTGEISPDALQDLRDINSYCEPSPSGTGLRFVARGMPPFPPGKEGRKSGNRELYQGGHYLTITGQRLPEFPATIEKRPKELNEFYTKYFGESEPEPELQQREEKRPGPLSSDAVERLEELFRAEPEFKNKLFNSAPAGERSTVECFLCARLWEAGFDRPEIYSILTSSPQTKWQARDDAYRQSTIEAGIAKAEISHKKRAEEGAPNSSMTTEEILNSIKADARALKDIQIIAALAKIRVKDPIEYDLLVDSVKKLNLGIKVATINALVDQYVVEHKKDSEQPEAPQEGIREKALAIAERGDPFKFLVWQAQRNHLGDIEYQKVLIASIASAASVTSKGIQPGGNGEKGSGKSDACVAAYHLVPADRQLDGSLSPMSLFYLQATGRLKPGMVLFSDDVEYEPIIPIYKRSTARFQKGTTHHTVSGGKTREAMELSIPPRLVWWLTAVETVANEQAFDRQYPISTDSRPEHKKMVCKEIAARRARKELQLAEDEGIFVAREILSDIFENGPFKVLVPHGEKAEWLNVSDFRGQEQFWDLVDALAILRWRQRELDPEGWLIADDQDIIEAKAILMGHKVAHASNLTEAEVKVVGALTDGLTHTQRELTEALNIAQSTLSDRLKSILAKSSAITEDYEGGRKSYAINPSFDLKAAYWDNLELIKLPIKGVEAYRSQQIALSGCYRYLIGIPIGIIINNSSRIPSSLSVNKEGSIEKWYPCDDCGSCPLKVYLSSIHSPAKETDNDQNQQQPPLSDTDKSPNTKTDKTDNASSEGNDIPIRQSSDPILELSSVYILADISLFPGVDGCSHGPFRPDEVVSLPAIHARNLVRSGKARAVNPGPRPGDSQEAGHD